jgi:starch synthase
VSRVGGLADTVVDADETALATQRATGVSFEPVDAAALGNALLRAKVLFQARQIWLEMRSNAMATDVSWQSPARHYAELYRAIAGIVR